MPTTTADPHKLDCRINVRLDRDRTEALRALAADAAVGVSDVLRRAIDRELECGTAVTAA